MAVSNKHSSPYRIPEGYFEKRIPQFIDIANVEPAKTTSVRQLVWISTATAAALILAIWIWPSQELSQLPEEDIEEYLFSEYQYGYTEISLEQELEQTEIQLESPALNEQEVEEFLEQNYDETLYYEYY